GEPLVADFGLAKQLGRSLEIENEEMRQSLLQEARIAARLHHNNLVQIYDVGQDQGMLYVAMELIKGMDLDELSMFYRKQMRRERLPWQVVLSMVRQVCRGLYHAHHVKDQQGHELSLIHRDLKPSNILLNHEGILKIIDFGIAKSSSNILRTKTGTVKGTPAYMSPEQLQNQKLDARTDLFSLGIVVYELCTNVNPFLKDDIFSLVYSVLQEEPAPPSTLCPDIPKEVDTLVAMMLKKDREERFPDARSVRRYVDTILQKYNVFLDQDLLADWLEDVSQGRKTPLSVPVSGASIAFGLLDSTSADLHTIEQSHAQHSGAEHALPIGFDKAAVTHEHAPSEVPDARVQEHPASHPAMPSPTAEQPPHAQAGIPNATVEQPPHAQPTALNAVVEQPPHAQTAIPNATVEQPPHSQPTVLNAVVEQPMHSLPTASIMMAEQPPLSQAAMSDATVEQPPHSQPTVLNATAEKTSLSQPAIPDATVEQPPHSQPTVLNATVEPPHARTQSSAAQQTPRPDKAHASTPTPEQRAARSDMPAQDSTQTMALGEGSLEHGLTSMLAQEAPASEDDSVQTMAYAASENSRHHILSSSLLELSDSNSLLATAPGQDAEDGAPQDQRTHLDVFFSNEQTASSPEHILPVAPVPSAYTGPAVHSLEPNPSVGEPAAEQIQAREQAQPTHTPIPTSAAQALREQPSMAGALPLHPAFSTSAAEAPSGRGSLRGLVIAAICLMLLLWLGVRSFWPAPHSSSQHTKRNALHAQSMDKDASTRVPADVVQRQDAGDSAPSGFPQNTNSLDSSEPVPNTEDTDSVSGSPSVRRPRTAQRRRKRWRRKRVRRRRPKRVKRLQKNVALANPLPNVRQPAQSIPQPSTPKDPDRKRTVQLSFERPCALSVRGVGEFPKNRLFTLSLPPGHYRLRCISNKERLLLRKKVSFSRDAKDRVRRNFRLGTLMVYAFPEGNLSMKPFGKIGTTGRPIPMFEGAYKEVSLVPKKPSAFQKRVRRFDVRPQKQVVVKMGLW
ncbi:MAG: protein kinase, partial [Myxococcota bacterium]